MPYYDPVTGLPTTSPPVTSGGGGGDLIDNSGGSSGAGGISPSGYSYEMTIPGSQPDWRALLESDPYLTQFRADLGSMSIADRAQLDAARQRALIEFGLVPESLGPLVGDLYSSITPETRALAEQNTREGLSTVGRLDREMARATQNIMDALAARGALRSGATGIALNDLGQQHKQAMSDAERQLLDYLAGIQRAYIDSERYRKSQLSSAYTDAAGRIDPNSLQGTPPKNATLAGVDDNGMAYYEDADGNYYDVSGNPYQPVREKTYYDTSTKLGLYGQGGSGGGLIV